MAEKKAGCLPTVLSTVFTTVAAPVLVSLLLQYTKPAPELSARQPPRPVAQACVSAGDLDYSCQIIVVGVGWTPEEALQDAAAKAVAGVAPTLVEPGCWVRNGPHLLAALRCHGNGLVTAYQDLECTKGQQQGREFFCRKVVVAVARQTLADRLAEAVASTR